MKCLRSLASSIVATAALALNTHSATLVWTNVSGGGWSTAANWSPNQVPASADSVFVTNAGTYTVTIDGVATAGELTIGGSIGGQTVLIDGNSLTVHSSHVIQGNGALSMMTGSVGGSATIHNGGLMTVAGGSFTGAGSLVIEPSGQLQVSDSVLFGGRDLLNAGEVLWTGGYLLQVGAFTNVGTMRAHTTSNVAITAAQFVNSGVFDRTAGVGFVTVAGPFINTGLVKIERDTLALVRGCTNNGSFALAYGATLVFSTASPDSVLGFGPSSTIEGTGNVAFGQWPTGGGIAAAVNGTLRVSGAVSISEADLTFLPGCVFTNSSIVVNGGIARFHTGRVIEPLSFTIGGGTLAGADSWSVDGPVTATGGNFSFDGSMSANSTLSVEGLYTFSGFLNNAGAATISSIYMLSNSVLHNLSTGTMLLSGLIQNAMGPTGPQPSVTNSGLLRHFGGGFVAPRLYNQGRLEVIEGTLTINRYVQSGGTSVLAGGTLTVPSGFRLDGGVLAGTGAVVGSVTNASIVSPGTSVGVLQITGDYVQTAAGMLEIELGGTSPSAHDRLLVSGAATLDGALRVARIPGYGANAGDAFRVLTFGTRSGDFAMFDDRTGQGLTRSYDATGLTVTAGNTIPVLAITRQATNVIVRWPSDATGFALQTATGLDGPWTTISTATNEVVFAAGASSAYYRLMKP